MNTNDSLLKLAMARLLPERIKIYNNPSTRVTTFFWIEPGSPRSVIETEWLYIVNLVEQGLHTNDQVDYIRELEQSFRREENIYFGEKPEKKFPLNEFGRFAVVSAIFNQRALAICKVKGIELENKQ